MRVFITGATGFLGGVLVRALAREGGEVPALARPTADRRALDGVAITWHELGFGKLYAKWLDLGMWSNLARPDLRLSFNLIIHPCIYEGTALRKAST
ncbi:MAG: NAD-dependent epimerase/dehydratase family protein [Terriglobia bacterium]|jgi:thioester reductase-like protein